MNILPKLPRRLKNRIRLVFSAIFSKTSALETTMASIQKAPDVVIQSWCNPFEVLPGFPSRTASLDKDTLTLCDRNLHPESSELDVATFLYELVLHAKASTVIEVGVYKGAGSLSMAQGLAENGGGEIHLVDISNDYLHDVHDKIAGKNWPVTIHRHWVDKNAATVSGELSQTDVLFIDACHSYEGVQEDLRRYLPLVVAGGFLILHDTIKHEGPRKSVAELFEKGSKTCSIASSRGSGITVLRVE